MQRLLKNNIKISKKVILADPGLLAPLLVDITGTNNKKKLYDLCVIPHISDRNSSLIKNKIKVNNSNILDIMESPQNFINSVLKCKKILSSSLHGLITADSLGIPNVMIIINDKIIGKDYKFRDYYSSYGIKLLKKIDLRNNTLTNNDLKSIIPNEFIRPEIIRKKQCQLLLNFPYPLIKRFRKFKNSFCKNYTLKDNL